MAAASLLADSLGVDEFTVITELLWIAERRQPAVKSAARQGEEERV